MATGVIFVKSLLDQNAFDLTCYEKLFRSSNVVSYSFSTEFHPAERLTLATQNARLTVTKFIHENVYSKLQMASK